MLLELPLTRAIEGVGTILQVEDRVALDKGDHSGNRERQEERKITKAYFYYEEVKRTKVAI